LQEENRLNFEKGMSFLEGDGVEKDYKTALFYLKKAASSGNLDACFAIVSTYLKNLFSKDDIDDGEALKFAKYGRDKGDKYFTILMAVLIEKILRDTKSEELHDPEVTLENMLNYYHEFADEGDPFAQMRLAKLYGFGILVKRDLVLADHWHRLSAEKKEPKALIAYVTFLMKHQEFDKALPFAKIGAEMEITGCMHALLAIYFLRKDAQNVKYWGEILEKRNDAEGMYFLHAIYISGHGIEKDSFKGIQYLRKAAEYGSSLAQLGLGELYLDFHYEDLHEGTVEVYPPDEWFDNAFEIGFFWLKKAADQGNVDAQFKLYENSSGEEAKHWLDMAVERGHSGAIAEIASTDTNADHEPSEQENYKTDRTAEVINFPRTFRGRAKSDEMEELRDDLNALRTELELYKSTVKNFPEITDTNELILAGESLVVEFKETFSLDTKKGTKKSPDIRYAALREICGFLNTGSGLLIIGVNDDKKVVGIENDGLDGDEDKYARTIHTFIADCLGSSAAANVDISFEKIQEKVVCLVKCQKGGSPTYLKFKGKEEQVFVRYGSITRSPPPSEWDRIKKERF